MTPLAIQLAVEESKVSPGLLGFLVVAGLAIATWFLLKSMNKQLKRVDFEEDRKSTGAESARDADQANHREGNGAPVA
ncbi:hypothetical protein [Embleya sp. NBC_00896]|uniref:hypothetical protein n=1 Tax=Embleya sp. NBC_00896 TaxID=2975961 RepID=UPI003866C129|nr:hypothetical protein OG928_20305 [Embleya sp. NBC_00896]